MLVYKAVLMSVCTTSPHFSDVKHFALNNPACDDNDNDNNNDNNNRNNKKNKEESPLQCLRNVMAAPPKNDTLLIA